MKIRYNASKIPFIQANRIPFRSKNNRSHSHKFQKNLRKTIHPSGPPFWKPELGINNKIFWTFYNSNKKNCETHKKYSKQGLEGTN